MPVLGDHRAWRRITRSRNPARGLLRHGRELAIIPDIEREPYAWAVTSTEWFCYVRGYHQIDMEPWTVVDWTEKVTLNVVQGALGTYDRTEYAEVKRRERFDPNKGVSVSVPEPDVKYDYDRPIRWRGEVKPEKRFKNDIEVED